MVGHIRAIASLCSEASGALLDGILGMATPSPSAEEEETQPIDVLVRNAFRHDTPHEADVSRVWSELSSRVMGPFGMLAVEGPAFAYTDCGLAHLSRHGRDIAAAATDGSSSLPVSDDVYSGGMYGGAGSHQMNQR